jgi:NADH-quinone oxidoreductase subunit I
MYGLGILKGLSVTLKHFVNTYVDDIKWGFAKRYTPEVLPARQSAEARGVFTVQYPEEVLPPQERFRFVPFLVYEGTDENRQYRCTACGICAKACPPQCIWIVRAKDPDTAQKAGRVLCGHRYLHELRLLRRVLPVRRDQDGSRF